MTAPPDGLTIVLTIKDRSAFTRRWMHYMNDRRCPHPILIADGGTDPDIESRLRNRDHYPNLSYTYIRYPIDHDYATYYKKFADAVARVSTPYVLLADNDDLFMIDSIPVLTRLLDEHPDVVSCGGRTISLSLISKDRQVLNQPTAPDYHAVVDHRSAPVTGDRAVDRLCYLLTNVERQRLWWAWYHVHRTPALNSAMALVREHDFRDPVTLELHLLLGLLMSGNFQQLEMPWYIRQEGTSQVTAEIRSRGNVIERFVKTDALDDLRRSVASFGSGMSAQDSDRLYKAIALWLAEEAMRHYEKTLRRAASSPPGDLVERVFRGVRRVGRPLVAPFRSRPARQQSQRLPELEPYILDRARF